MSNTENCLPPPKFDIHEIVPKFDGNCLELSTFLDTANTLLPSYWDQNPTNLSCVQTRLQCSMYER